jgi:hypothetical protein
LTATPKVLERRGLVRVAVDPRDRCGCLLARADAGHAVLAAAVPAWQRHHRAIDRCPGDADALRTELQTTGGGRQDHRPPAAPTGGVAGKVVSVAAATPRRR